MMRSTSALLRKRLPIVVMGVTGVATTGLLYYSTTKSGKQNTKPALLNSPPAKSEDKTLSKQSTFLSRIAQNKINPFLHFASINSNEPTEDQSSHSITNKKDLILGIYDGHGGSECAKIVSKYLPSYIEHQLSQLTSKESTSQVKTAIKSAFLQLDGDILKGAFAKEHGDQVSLRSALSGSCAAVAYIHDQDAYVAVTGDCRVVVGKRTSAGFMQAIPLSEDQTIKNAHEYARMIELHPKESDTLFVRGRVLGGLMPTRAFGDARYKWPLETNISVIQNGFSKRRIPPNYLTPPYVTAEPEVVHYKLTEPHFASNWRGDKVLAGDLFMVVACDGVFDELSNEEVVDSVHNWMGKADEKIPPTPLSSKVIDTSNAATHLIRRCLEVAGKGNIEKLLSVPAPQCRKMRDDMSAYVLFFREKEQLYLNGVPQVDQNLATCKKEDHLLKAMV